MSSRIFYLFVTILIAAGIYFKFIAGGSSLKLGSANNEIVPSDEWAPILIGDWNFQERIMNDDSAYTIEGDLLINGDGSFERFITISYYEHPDITPKEEELYQGFLEKKFGGKVTGTWSQVTGKGWQETVSSENSDTTGLMNRFYSKGSLVDYGNFSDERTKTQMTRYNQDSIRIEGRDFATGAFITIQMGRKKSN